MSCEVNKPVTRSSQQIFIFALLSDPKIFYSFSPPPIRKKSIYEVHIDYPFAILLSFCF